MIFIIAEKSHARQPIAKTSGAYGGAIDGMDALLSIAQMPPGVPAASVGLNAMKNVCAPWPCASPPPHTTD